MKNERKGKTKVRRMKERKYVNKMEIEKTRERYRTEPKNRTTKDENGLSDIRDRC